MSWRLFLLGFSLEILGSLLGSHVHALWANEVAFAMMVLGLLVIVSGLWFMIFRGN